MAIAVAITGEGLGRGDEGLGRRLIVKFIQQLAGLSPRPAVLTFYNSGVKLLVAASPVIEALRALEADGVELLACGTCLDHFGIRDKLAVGRVSDMREILHLLMESDKSLVV